MAHGKGLYLRELRMVNRKSLTKLCSGKTSLVDSAALWKMRITNSGNPCMKLSTISHIAWTTLQIAHTLHNTTATIFKFNNFMAGKGGLE